MDNPAVALAASLLLIAGCASAPASPPPPEAASPAELAPVGAPLPWAPRLVDLRWLVGDWVGTDRGGACVIERWLPAQGGSMLGALEPDGGLTETARLQRDERGLVMTAVSAGGATTSFRLTTVSDNAFLAVRDGGGEPCALRYALTPAGGLDVQRGDTVHFTRAPPGPEPACAPGATTTPWAP